MPIRTSGRTSVFDSTHLTTVVSPSPGSPSVLASTPTVGVDASAAAPGRGLLPPSGQPAALFHLSLVALHHILPFVASTPKAATHLGNTLTLLPGKPSELPIRRADSSQP